MQVHNPLCSRLHNGAPPPGILRGSSLARFVLNLPGMILFQRSTLLIGALVGLSACSGGASSPDTGGGGGTTTGSTVTDTGDCTLTENTTATATVSPEGCAVLDRDTSGCADTRKAQGLSGFWLNFSCRVSLSASTQGGAQVVMAAADGQPDYRTEYFPMSNACYVYESGSIHNPNEIAAQTYVVQFPLSPDTTSQAMTGAVVGLAANGVPIFGNFAAPGDDIYFEVQSFDVCGGHPQGSGMYHYHTEPYALSYDDDRFIGVMRDGYPVYGRRDPGGASPTLDAYGGHTGVTVDSPSTPVYHYHVNEQTSTGAMTAGQKAWFLTTGTYRGTPAGCGSCN